MRDSQTKILIADDQPQIIEALEFLLKPEGYTLERARTPAHALECLSEHDFDACLIDLNYSRDTTSGQEGLNLITSIRQRDANLPLIVMTAWANVDLAVEAMRRGASDFVQKPWENPRLLSIMRTQVQINRCQEACPVVRSGKPHPPRGRRARSNRRCSFHATGHRAHGAHRSFRRKRSHHR